MRQMIKDGEMFKLDNKSRRDDMSTSRNEMRV